jgi:hypothetical protein
MAYLAAYQVCEPPEPSKWELVAEGEEEVVGLGKQLAASREAEDQALAQQVGGAAGYGLWPGCSDWRTVVQRQAADARLVAYEVWGVSWTVR